uniref:Core-2/I-branching enzyme n=1 Tax=viral metagenome TaxID=1070528 RepID=A0A6C0HDE3_9ZZZZ
MKAALCFIISYEHQLNKEKIWKDWVEPNKDIINVYFHYKDFDLIKSDWIKKHALPKNYLVQTDYLHIVPAYLTLMFYGMKHDRNNQWYCFLTDSCVPIISPLKFREIFFENYIFSFLGWRKAWWNTSLVKRANLHYLQPEFRLSNTPWFILNRFDAYRCILYSQKNKGLYDFICRGDVANESIFAIMLRAQNSLNFVKNEYTTLMDWTRMMNKTSPHLFKDGDNKDKKFIEDSLKENTHSIFLRKVDKKFPDDVLLEYIKEDDDISVVEKRRRRIFWLKSKMVSLKYYYFFLYYLKNYYYYFFFLGFAYFFHQYFVRFFTF